MPDNKNENGELGAVTGPQPEAAPSPRPLTVADITDPDEWVKEKGDGTEVIKLPSGRVVRCKKHFDMRILMMGGNLPNILQGAIQENMKGGKKAKSTPDVESVEDMAAMIDFMEKIFVDAVVEPIVVIPPKVNVNGVQTKDPKWKRPQGVWSVDMFDFEDIGFVNSFLGNEVQELVPFREEQD